MDDRDGTPAQPQPPDDLDFDDGLFGLDADVDGLAGQPASVDVLDPSPVGPDDLSRVDLLAHGAPPRALPGAPRRTGGAPAGAAEADDDDLEDDLDVGHGVDEAALTAAMLAGQAAAGPAEDRLARLEAAARALAEAEVTRENGRVRRKVKAATTGAGLVGFVPVLLQLVGAFDLPPQLSSTVAAGAAILGAFAAGWATPERAPALPDATAHRLIEPGAD